MGSDGRDGTLHAFRARQKMKETFMKKAKKTAKKAPKKMMKMK